MRTKSSVNDERLLAMIDDAMAEINSVCEPKSVYRVFECEVTETTVKAGGFEFESRRLAQNLAGCTKVCLLYTSLHPLGRIAFGEILPQGVGGESHFVEITFLFLTHDDAHHLEGQMSLLAVFLESLSLGAVSYTHLDVYKRQADAFSRRCCGCGDG